jgi:hypothetical protein
MSAVTSNGNGGQRGSLGGVPWPVILTLAGMLVGGLWTFAELKGDVRVLAERQESAKQDVADIKRDLRAIRAALGVPARDRFDGRE